MNPLVSIILVNHNGERDLEGCLASIFAETADIPDLEVVLVDNASTDRSLSLVPVHDARVKVHAQKENLGFAEGCNVAARAATGEWLVGVNLDTRGQRGWLARLLEAADRYPDAGAYSCRLATEDGQGNDFVSGTINFEGYGFESTEPLPDGTPILFPTGAGFMLRRRLWHEIGGMDASFFLFFEDVDLGWRLNLMGLPVLHVPSATLRHRKHGAVGALGKHGRMPHYIRNAIRMIAKNYDDEILPRMLSASLLLLLLRQSILEERETPGVSQIISRMWGKDDLSALPELGAQIDSVLADRRRVQQHRTVSDREILRRFFPDPFRTWAFDDEDYAKLHAANYDLRKAEIIDLFGLTKLFA